MWPKERTVSKSYIPPACGSGSRKSLPIQGGSLPIQGSMYILSLPNKNKGFKNQVERILKNNLLKQSLRRKSRRGKRR